MVLRFEAESGKNPGGGRVITVADSDGNLFDLVDKTYERELVAKAENKL